MKEAAQCVGPYRIVEMLGRGSMGVVYRARHLATGACVAVKTVAVPHEERLQSIRREIHALARLRHPGIVGILDEGLCEGLPWYAMELLEGVPLRRFVERVHALPIQAVLTVVRRLCSALGYMHGEGIVHRDLKPDNILILTTSGEQRTASSEKRATRSEKRAARSRQRAAVSTDSDAPSSLTRRSQLAGPGSPFTALSPSPLAARGSQLAAPLMPVLVDFGLASQFAGKVGREELDPVEAGGGSVAYMAPEQIRGELVDARADLYALGCVLYELLSGRRPFEGVNVPEIVHGHLHGVPARLSELVEGVSVQLEALVLALLAKRPRDRPGHADDVAVALEALGAEDGLGRAGSRPRAYLYRPGFTGREEPLRALVQHLERLEQGQGGVLLIGGESGAGKTRLAMELAREARRRKLRVLHGEGVSLSGTQVAGGGAAQGGAALQALQPVLEAIADRCRGRGPEETERLLGRRGPVLALYAPSLRGLGGQKAHPQPAELPPAAALLRLYSYLAETLEALAESRPLLLLLDDLQWADELTVGFVEFVLRAGRIGQTPLLVVGTYRSEEMGDARNTPLRRLQELAGVVRLALGRLPEPAVGAMVADMLALSAAPQGLVRYLSGRSGGNPFFVAEYLRTAVAEGMLCRDGVGHWQVAKPGNAEAGSAPYEALPLPGSIRELLGRRLGSLSSGARRTVERCSVLGREFDEGLLARMSRMGARGRMEAIGDLLARHVLEEPEVRGYEARLRFVHDQLREVAYEGISAGRRPKLHRSAAKAIEARFGRESAEHQAALGHHWQLAGLRQRARECNLSAARLAAAHYAHAEAERLFRAYLALVEVATPESITARNELGEKVLQTQGRNSEAAEQHHRALQEARQLPDLQLEVRSLTGLGAVCFSIGQVEEAKARYEEALALAGRACDRQGEAVLLRNLANLHMLRSDDEETRELYRRAGKLAGEVGDLRLVGTTVSGLGNLESRCGRLEEARRLYQEAIELFHRIDEPRLEGMVLANLAVNRQQQGMLSESRELHERALALHRQVGHRRFEGVTLLNLSDLSAEEGRMDEAQRLLAQALQIHREVGNRRLEALCLLAMSYHARLASRFEEAAELLRESEYIFGELGSRFDLVQCACERGLLHQAQGHSARRDYEQTAALAASLGDLSSGSLKRDLSVLRRAVEAFEAGRPLWRGQCAADLPEGVRRWIERAQQA